MIFAYIKDGMTKRKSKKEGREEERKERKK